MGRRITRGEPGKVTVPQPLLQAISDPGSRTERRWYEDGSSESVSHWAARAVLRWAERAVDGAATAEARQIGQALLTDQPELELEVRQQVARRLMAMVDRWPRITRDMVSRGQVYDWLLEQVALFDLQPTPSDVLEERDTAPLTLGIGGPVIGSVQLDIENGLYVATITDPHAVELVTGPTLGGFSVDTPEADMERPA